MIMSKNPLILNRSEMTIFASRAVLARFSFSFSLHLLLPCFSLDSYKGSKFESLLKYSTVSSLTDKSGTKYNRQAGQGPGRG